MSKKRQPQAVDPRNDDEAKLLLRRVAREGMAKHEPNSPPKTELKNEKDKKL